MDNFSKNNQTVNLFENIFHILTEILNYSTKFMIEKISLTPLWRAFIYNDGSMTMFLTHLFKNLKFKLISSEKALFNDILELNNVEKLIGLKVGGEIVKRIISFSENEEMIMEGISYWNSKIYHQIFNNELDVAIGKILIQKEVEFYRKIDKIFVFNHKESFIFLRISHYKFNGNLAFVLIEIIYPQLFYNYFGNLIYK